MGRIYDEMTKFLESEKLVFQPFPERGYAALHFTGTRVSWRCFAVANDELEVFKLLVQLPERVPGDQRAPMAEFITRANFGLNVGAFEMDMSDGELRFRVGVDLENTADCAPLLRQCLAAGLTTAERYYPGFMSILHADAHPRDAIAEVEGSEVESAT